jgi:hypothetical protein
VERVLHNDNEGAMRSATLQGTLQTLGLYFSNLSQYRDVMSEVLRKKVVGQCNIKKGLGAM